MTTCRVGKRCERIKENCPSLQKERRCSSYSRRSSR